MALLGIVTSLFVAINVRIGLSSVLLIRIGCRQGYQQNIRQRVFSTCRISQVFYAFRIEEELGLV